jgi:hypothetical protein
VLVHRRRRKGGVCDGGNYSRTCGLLAVGTGTGSAGISIIGADSRLCHIAVDVNINVSVSVSAVSSWARCTRVLVILAQTRRKLHPRDHSLRLSPCPVLAVLHLRIWRILLLRLRVLVAEVQQLQRARTARGHSIQQQCDVLLAKAVPTEHQAAQARRRGWWREWRQGLATVFQQHQVQTPHSWRHPRRRRQQ